MQKLICVHCEIRWWVMGGWEYSRGWIIHSVSLSSTCRGARISVLLVYTICPFMIISSRM